jgi:hypothetical protein
MSKGIDALNNLLLEISEVVIDEKTMLPGFKLPKHQCERIEIIKKELRALEIITKKNVDIYSIKVCINVEHYNSVIKSRNFNNNYSYEIWYNLTEEEFDLIKEVLK